MALQDMLKTHREALDEARKVLGRKTRSEADLATPGKLAQRRASIVEARIRTLEAQKQEMIRRLDAAVAEEREMLSRIRAEEKAWSERQATPKGKPAAKTTRPARGAKAAKLTTTTRNKRSPGAKKS